MINQILVGRAALSPGIPVNLYTVPQEIAYSKCDLTVVSSQRLGITFQLSIGLTVPPLLKDYLYFYNTPMLDDAGIQINNYTFRNLIMGTNEKMIILTEQSDLVIRLTGYSFQSINNSQLTVL